MSSAASIRSQVAIQTRIPGALDFRPRPAPEILSTGIPELDELCGGLPRGSLTEICGPPSSGRTTVVSSILRQVTRREECCALIDISNTFDPGSAARNDVDLRRLLWIRCAGWHRKLTPIDKALQAADLVINAGGFGLIVLDLADIEPRLARRIPLASWYRFRRNVETTRTVFLVVDQQPCAGSCASAVLTLEQASWNWEPTLRLEQNPALFTSTSFTGQLGRSLKTDSAELRLPKKPVGSATIFRFSTAWAG
jgi:recombination protein RecA